jgi:hypothetical protein
MRLPSLVYSVLLYGSLVVAVIALFWHRIVPPSKRAPLPDATALGSPVRRVLGKIVTIGNWGVFLLALALALFLYATAVKVVVVTDGGASRMVHVGGSVSYDLAPGEHPWKDDLFEPTWVVNESSHEVKIVHVVYGQGLGLDQDPTLLPPGTATTVLHVDDIGPNSPPPRTVMDGTGLKMDFRDWVTW